MVFCQSAKPVICVIQTDPNSVACYSGDPLAEIATIQIEEDPDYVLFSRDRNSLYVLHRGWDGSPQTHRFDGPRPAQLSVVDLKSATVTSQIPLGTGVRSLYEANDGTLFGAAQGRWRISEQKNLKPEFAAKVTVLSGSAHQVLREHQLEGLIQDFAITRDGKRLFAFSGGTRYGTTGDAVLAGLTLGLMMKRVLPKNVDQRLHVFGAEKPEELMSIPLQIHVDAMGFSRDETKLFVLGRRLGEKAERGKEPDNILQLIDVSNGGMSNEHLLGKGFRKLVPAGDEGYLIVGPDDLRVLRHNGHLEQAQPLQRDRNDPALVPGEMVLFSDGRAVCLMEDEKGRPTNKIIGLDLGSGKITGSTTLGRGSVRVGATIKQVILGASLSALTNGFLSALGVPYFLFFYPQGVAPRRALATSADGAYVFGLDTASKEITVLRASTLEIAARFPVSENTFRLWVPPQSKYLFALSPDNAVLFDTVGLKEVATFKYTGGSAQAIEIDPKKAQLYVLSSKALDVFDGENGELVASLKGLKSPRAFAVAVP